MWKVKGLLEKHPFHKPMEKHSLCPSAPSPKAPRHWIINGCALGSCARSLAVRALCAHPRKKAPRHWIIIGFPLGSCARSLAVRAPVRAPKEVQCFAIGQSHRTNGEVVEWA